MKERILADLIYLGALVVGGGLVWAFWELGAYLCYRHRARREVWCCNHCLTLTNGLTRGCPDCGPGTIMWNETPDSTVVARWE
jgi:hypothetical protein